MDIYQISDRYTYLKESSIKHNKNYLFSKKGKYFFDENLSIYYHSSINTLCIELVCVFSTENS